jgi:acetyl esterase/lipase
MKRLLMFVAALGGLVTLGVLRRRPKLANVAAELRSPALYVPMSLRSDRSLRLGRTMMAKTPQRPLAPGVERRVEQVPADGPQPAVPVVVYELAGRARPSGALVWIHGGGLVMGTPEAGDELCGRFAAELGIVVVSVDYRLAPEHPFPAGLDDCYAALSWVHARAEDLGVDTAKVVVGGDSAGGGLAACLAQLAHDRGGPDVCFQLLQYPMLDDRTALRTDVDALTWTNTSNRYAWSAYLGHPVRTDEPRPYAAAARRDDLSGLPPAWIGVGTIDLFHDECVDYAARLEAAGVDCRVHIVPGMYHAAERVVPKAPSMVAMLDDMTAALRAATA